MKPEHGGQIGNPPHEWDPEIAERVREFAELCNQEETARRAGIALGTLHKYYHDDWYAGHQTAVHDVKAMMLKQAREGSVNAGKVVLQMAGELKRQVEVAAPGGGPIRTVDMGVLAQLVDGKTDEELRTLEQALALVLAAAGVAGGPDDGSPDAGLRPGGEAAA